MLTNHVPKLNDDDLIVTPIHSEFENLDKQFKNISKNNCNVLFNILLDNKEDLPKTEKYLKRISQEGYYANPCLIQSDNTYTQQQQQDYEEIYNYFTEYAPNYYDTYQISLNNGSIDFCEFFKIYNNLNNLSKNVLIKNNTFWIENNEILMDIEDPYPKPFKVSEIKPSLVKMKNRHLMLYTQLYNEIHF